MELGNWSIKNQLGSTNSKGLPVLFQGSHQGFLLNNHYLPMRRQRGLLLIAVFHDIQDGTKSGGTRSLALSLHRPVPTHGTAFWAPTIRHHHIPPILQPFSAAPWSALTPNQAPKTPVAPH